MKILTPVSVHSENVDRGKHWQRDWYETEELGRVNSGRLSPGLR